MLTRLTAKVIKLVRVFAVRAGANNLQPGNPFRYLVDFPTGVTTGVTTNTLGFIMEQGIIDARVMIGTGNRFIATQWIERGTGHQGTAPF